MTARVTTLKGAEAGVYYVEALPSYYLDAGEPAGIWHGRGAQQLGLVGEVNDADFLDVMAGVHPRSGGATLGRGFGEKSVRGFDVTASAPKSVSTMFAIGDIRIRGEVLASHDSAVAAMLGWVEDHAHTRFRINGDVAVVNAKGIIATTFRQHTSRALDPQLHTHVVIANRVRSPDGRWLALDARTLKLDQRTLSGIYHATLRAELTSRLGVSWRPVENGIAEMAEVSDVVLAEFSTRTADIARRIDEKLDRFIDTTDREPTPRERWRLEREAVIDSRPPKAHTHTAADLHAQWSAQVEALGIDAAGVAYDVIGPLRSQPVSETFLAAFRARRQYDLDRPDALVWLIGIARNVSLNTNRATARFERIPPPHLGWDDATHRLVDGLGAKDRLNAEVAPQLQRAELAIFRMRAEGYSYSEIETAVGRPAATLRSIAQRARRRLRNLARERGQ